MKSAFARILAFLRIKRNRMLFFRLDLDPRLHAGRPAVEGLAIEQVSEAGAENLRDFEDSWLTRAQMIERIRQGQDLFIVRCGGEKANYRWVLYRRFFVAGLDRWFELPTGCAYLSGVYTRPAYRRRGIARFSYAHVFDHLLGRGVRTVFLNVDTTNEPSLRNVRKLGFQEYQRGELIRLGFIRIYRIVNTAGTHCLIRISRRPDARLNRLCFTDGLATEDVPC
ncbi:MAG: GNAT family N-acetyltransferase [bacterium]|nr:GNAT family N-acetyltransferase [bacterium]